MTSLADPVAPAPAHARAAIRRVAAVALYAIVLGFVMQALIVAFRLVAGLFVPPAVILAELVASVSWSVLVCTGVAVAMSIGKARAVLAGLAAFVFAPLALAAAKAAEKLMLAVLDAVEAPQLLPIEAVGIVRAVEYGLLAWLLTYLTEKGRTGLAAYLLTGLAIGVGFGGAVAALTLSAAEAPTALLAGTVLIREIGAPLGCAMVIFVGQSVASNYRALGTAQA